MFSPNHPLSLSHVKSAGGQSDGLCKPPGLGLTLSMMQNPPSTCDFIKSITKWFGLERMLKLI